jgi:hypothetical protein
MFARQIATIGNKNNALQRFFYPEKLRTNKPKGYIY